MRSLRWKRALPWAALVLTFSWFALVRRGGADADPVDPTDPPTAGALPEPITGLPSTPEPGDETGPMTPFAPPEPGNVPIEDLTPAEQAYIEAGLDVSGWPAVHNAFAAAGQQAAQQAQAEAAANALGIEGLGDVP